MDAYGGDHITFVMDVKRTFIDSRLISGVSINIQGSTAEPLFRTSQIGALFALSNDRFANNNDCVDALKDKNVFLTHSNLYALLGKSRNKLVRHFLTWVGNVLTDLRLAEKRELEQRVMALTLEAQKQDIARLALALQASHLMCDDHRMTFDSTKLTSYKLAVSIIP